MIIYKMNISIKKLKSLLYEDQTEICVNYQQLCIEADVKLNRSWSNGQNTTFGIFFDLIEKEEVLKCSYYTRDKKECLEFKKFDKKNCLVVGNLKVDKKYHTFQLDVKSIELKEEKLSKTDEMKKICMDHNLFENKKEVDWNHVRKIGVLSKEGTQGYCDFLQQLQIPIKIELEEIPLEGKQTADEIIKKIEKFNMQENKVDVILIIRGGGSTTDIANSFDKMELFFEMKKSNIPIITAIGHANDTNENLFITNVSDMDYPTPTSLSKTINSIIFQSFQIVVSKYIHQVHQQFLLLMNEKQNKIVCELRKKVQQWTLQFSKYHIVDLSNIPSDKDVLFLIDGVYYKQTICVSNPILIDKDEICKKEVIDSMLEQNDIVSMYEFIQKENDNEETKQIKKLCKSWLENENEIESFGDLESKNVDWEILKKKETKRTSFLQLKKQMYSHLLDNVLYHPIDFETYEQLLLL